jgi:hypothetical protein
VTDGDPGDVVLMSNRNRSIALLMMAMALLILGPSACSRPSPPSSGSSVPISLKDYRISSSLASAPAGLVTFDIHNRGPSTHELVVLQTDEPADRMPIGADGLSFDEESPLLVVAGELAQIDIGSSASLALRLDPGRYVLACNMQGHYRGGMFMVLTIH